MSDDRLYDFQLPDLGEGVVEGELVAWRVQPGQEVAADQALVQVMTDKATVEIPSPRKGTVKQLYFKEGDIVPVGAAMVQLELAPGEAPPPAPAGAVSHMPARPSAPAKPPPPQSRVPGGRPVAPASAPLPSLGRVPTAGGRPAAPSPAPVPQPAAAKAHDGATATLAPERKPLATPAVRQLARELGVDLAKVPGSGPAGRVIREDVEAAARPTAPATATAAPAVTFAPGEREQRHPVRGLRRKIAEKMVQSAFTAPHVTHVDEADMTALVTLRARAKEVALARGTKLSYLPFVIKACVAALKEFPHFNASFDHEASEIVVKGYYHIGFGVATDQGLLVGVIKDADRMSILQLAAQIQDIAGRVRDGKATLDELTGSTFTLTNFGSLGGLFATPIINYPEVAILGLGKIQARAVVRDGQVVPREMMYLALSFDHRVVDGAAAVHFTDAVIRYLEAPELLFLDAQ